MTITTPITLEWAEKIYEILVRVCGAPCETDSKSSFFYHQTKGSSFEYHFRGVFGAGGKFWNNHSWYVNYYQERETPAFKKIQEQANKELEALYQEWLQSLLEV